MSNETPATSVDLEIQLPISRPLKQREKDAILQDINSRFSNISPVKLGPTSYRERHAQGLPLELIVNVTTLIANVILIVQAVHSLNRWVEKTGNEDAGICVKVDGQSYSIRNCKTPEDVIKIIREIKRK